MRLFAGIELDAATRAACVGAQDKLRSADFDARFEAAEKLHVTLAFLGKVEEPQRKDVEDVLHSVARVHTAFTLTLDKLGAFPNERRPRIVYVGSRDAGPAYRTIAVNLRAALAALGFSFEADAVAHVTVARIKGGSRRPLPMFDLAPASLPVSELVLFESLPFEGSTRYAPRARYSLAQ